MERIPGLPKLRGIKQPVVEGAGTPTAANERGAKGDPVFGTRLEKLLGFLGTARPSEDEVTSKRVALEAYEDKVLFDMVLKGTEESWKDRPAFYRALIDELRERGLIE